jgi:hypothetical protein
MEVHLLSLLPVTSLESFTSDNLSKKIKRVILASRLNIPVLASNRKLIRPTNVCLFPFFTPFALVLIHCVAHRKPH